LLLIIFLILPPFEPLTKLGMKVAGIFFFTVIWWAMRANMGALADGSGFGPSTKATVIGLRYGTRGRG
jgi:hypothetical protein